MQIHYRVTHNLWSKPSAQGGHIIALQTKIGKLETFSALETGC